MKSITGTIAVTQGSSTITGTGTQFRAETEKGSILIIGGAPYVVASAPASDTALTLGSPWRGETASGLTAELA